MLIKATLSAAAALLLVGCVSTEQDVEEASIVGDWIVEASTDPDTQEPLLFATLFPQVGSDDQILWLGLICGDDELEVGFGLTDAYDPALPLVITSQVDGGAVIDRQGDFFGEGDVIGFASNDVALAFLDEIAGGTDLIVTADGNGVVQGPAIFEITGASTVAQQIRRDCF